MSSDHPDSLELHEYRKAVLVGVLLLIMVAICAAALIFPVWARRQVMRQADHGALSEAQAWLRWSSPFGFDSDETELMRAICLRRLGQMDLWEAVLESLRATGANPRGVLQEHTLGLIRLGVEEVPEEYWRDPAGVGLRTYDAIEVCVRGHLARNEPGKADQILRFWEKALPDDGHVAYLRGVYWFHQGDDARALADFETAVTRQPEHELAQTGVARLLEKQDRLTEALAAYVRFASDCPSSDVAVLGIARVLRGLGYLEQARAVAESLDSSLDLPAEFWSEMGSIELESANYQEALRWFDQVPAISGQKKQQLERDAGTSFALLGEPAIADRFFKQADAAEGIEVQISELLPRLVVFPNGGGIVEELDRLSASAAQANAQSVPIEQEFSRVARREDTPQAASDLYALHCAACHGADGNGDGRAARHQFPWPRGLRRERFRLVSTYSTNPTLEDVKNAIKRGMPGTSMRAYDDFTESQLELLAEEVLRMRREGVRERFVAILQAEEEEIDEEEVQEVVDLHSLPGELVQVPTIGSADAVSITRGRSVYLETGCRPCHGENGTGESEIPLFNEEGQPCWSRDLVNDPFKGGHEPESIYLRILAGMPGSPHPATTALTNQQYVDLVQFCGSLSREPKRTLTNHQRFLEATQRPLP